MKKWTKSLTSFLIVALLGSAIFTVRADNDENGYYSSYKTSEYSSTADTSTGAPRTVADYNPSIDLATNNLCLDYNGHPIVWPKTEVGIAYYIQRVFTLINEERTSRGLNALAWSDALVPATNLRAQEIVSFFSHTRPDGSDCFTAIENRGQFRMLGENLAAGCFTPEDAVTNWMNSPGHRANILEPSFTEMAIGYRYESGTLYGAHWSNFFAQR